MRTSTSITIAVAHLLLATAALAQRPQPSPPAQTIQTIGLSDVTITYSRPGVKGREVWGGLVPHGKIWRAGANDKTFFTFEEDTIVGGKRIPPGNYSFYILPNENQWTLIFNTDWEGHGTKHNEDADILRFNVTPQAAPHEEWLRYGFDDLQPYRATAYLHWEKRKASFQIQTAPELPQVNDQVNDQVSEQAAPILAVVDAAIIETLTQDTSGLVIDMADATIHIHRNQAHIEGITSTSPSGDKEISMKLEKRNNKWRILK